MRTLKTAAALALLLAATGAAYRQTPAAPRTATAPSAADKAAARAAHMTPEQVIAEIHAINRTEIEAGTLALRKSKDSEIIRYSKLLVRDHELCDSKLRAFARKEGLAVGAAKRDPDDTAALGRLESAAPGPEFDRAFADMMKMGHDKADAALTAARGSATNMRLRAFIDKVLPVIRQHRKLAAELQGKRLG
jgi:putative membrane protein